MKNKKPNRRNDALIDKWSLVHFCTSAALALLIGPFVAFAVTLLWEPLEIFVISPLLAKFGIVFGHESFRNSLSDIAFNTLGILAAILLIAR